jgi:tetratricopeptide (TPR) repeat protein
MKTKVNANLLRYFGLLPLTLLIYANCFTQSGFPYTYGDNMMYHPKLYTKTTSLQTIKDGLAKALQQAVQVYDAKTTKTYNAKDIKTYNIYDDRIEVVLKAKKKDNLVWLFDAIDDSTLIFFGKQNAGTFVFLPGVANFGFSNFYSAQQLADNVYALQYPVIDRLRDSILTAFRNKVEAFRNTNRMAIPNALQRSLFEKADSICDMDDHFEGIRAYLKAISIDEMANPTAYANLGLLYAHINYFDYAIMYMKKYIMLEVDIVKQRGALDKLYEWEGIIYY